MNAPKTLYDVTTLRSILLGGQPPQFGREHVAGLLGVPLLAYVTASDPESVRAAVSGAATLAQRAQESLDAALEQGSHALDVRRQSASNDDSPPGPHEPAFTVLAELFSGRANVGHLTFADALRVHAGGTVPDLPSTDGATEHFLADHARSCYGALLIPRGRDEEASPWARTPGRLPLDREDEWLECLRQDRGLAAMFPSLTSVTASSKGYLTSAGRGGGGLQAISIPGLVVTTAVRRGGWPNGVALVTYLEQAVAVVRELRALVARETVEVPAWVLLHGLDVEDVPFAVELRRRSPE